jgi:hypothetical protein
MATYSFEDDFLVGNDPLMGIVGSQQIGANATTVTIGLGNATDPVTINPFGSVTMSDTAGSDLVRLRVLFSDAATTIGSANASLTFDGGGTSGTLAFGQSATFVGTDENAQAWLRSILVVSNSTNDVFSIALRYSNEANTSNFSSRTLSYRLFVACYQQGTLIRTPAGDRAVEMLRAGDLVTTLDGTAKAVKWIGHRSYEAEFGASEAFVRPVVFKAGSLGGGLPARDLRVSPQHGMLIDGAMVPAAALVNGVSILREENPGDISYFHIELEGHEAVFAEGAASETFVDHDSRAMFDNADEYNLIYGASAPRPAEQPRLEEGFQLAAIRRRLAEIAGITANPTSAGPVTGHLESLENGILTGWLVDSAAAEAVEAEVLVDGEVVGRVVANRYRSDLDQAGIGGGRGGFSIALPASAERLEQVTVRRVFDGKVLVGGVLETARA